jgi:two-component sensor histidine kinase
MSWIESVSEAAATSCTRADLLATAASSSSSCSQAASAASTWLPVQSCVHVAVDLLLFVAYAAVSVTLAHRVRRSGESTFLPFSWAFVALSALCSLIHLADAVTFWQPSYHLLTGIALLLSFLSWASAASLLRLLISALALHSERDRDARARADQLSSTLRECEELWREARHRLRNNLQTVLSLISLQRRRVRDGEVQQALQQCEARVFAVAQAHQVLRSDKSGSRVPLARYVEGLIAGFDLDAIKQQRVRIETDVDDVLLPVESSVPCGLILHELISNALRHGFAGAHAGTVRVSARCSSKLELTLEVSHDGVALPTGFEPTGHRSLGLSLVELLTGQLKGQLSFSHEGGTAFRICFPTPDLAAHAAQGSSSHGRDGRRS